MAILVDQDQENLPGLPRQRRPVVSAAEKG